MKKKSSRFLVCLLIVLAAFLSLNGGGQQSSAPASADIVTPGGQFPIVRDKVTLKFFSPIPPQIEDLFTNIFTVQYEAMTNVHIDWETVPSAALNERKNLSLASGDYPDVYFGANLTFLDEEMYGPAGVLIRLNDLVEKYSVFLNENRRQDPTIDDQMFSLDGSIYALPSPSHTPHMWYPRRYWVNHTWMENLGIAVPTTTEELYNMLVAFKTRDPNRNGRADELPLILNSATALDGITYFMNSFIYDDGGSKLLIDDNEKISMAYVQNGWRDGLAFLRRLYSENLLDTASFTVTDQQIRQLIESGNDPIVGGTVNLAVSSFADLNGQRSRSFHAIPPVKGPAGVQFAAWQPYIHGTGNYAVTKACKHPDVAVRWVDWLYTWEGALRSREGQEGIGWKRPDPGTLSYTGGVATWQRLDQYGSTYNDRYDGIGYPHNMLIHSEQSGSDDIYAPNGAATRNYRASIIYAPYAPKKASPPLRIPSADAMRFSQLSTDIAAYWRESAVQFITGGMDLNRDWNAYVANFNNLQLDRYVSLLQASYDAFLAKKK